MLVPLGSGWITEMVSESRHRTQELAHEREHLHAEIEHRNQIEADLDKARLDAEAANRATTASSVAVARIGKLGVACATMLVAVGVTFVQPTNVAIKMIILAKKRAMMTSRVSNINDATVSNGAEKSMTASLHDADS